MSAQSSACAAIAPSGPALNERTQFIPDCERCNHDQRGAISYVRPFLIGDEDVTGAVGGDKTSSPRKPAHKTAPQDPLQRQQCLAGYCERRRSAVVQCLVQISVGPGRDACFVGWHIRHGM
jgi:hypothetical protein